MARGMSKTNKEENTSVKNDAAEQVEVKTETKPAPRKFNNEDEIACVSITPGEMFVDGYRSKDLYTFADFNDVQYIRYDDLIYLIRRKDVSVFSPRFIIQDKEFLAQNKNVAEIYNSLYSTADLKDVLKLKPNELRNKILSLPEGAKEALKILASTMIDKGRLDSVATIKVLDEVFGTEMLRKVVGA